MCSTRWIIGFLNVAAICISCVPLVAQAPAAPAPETKKAVQKDLGDTSAAAVARLVDRLRTTPIKPTATDGRVGLYLMDLTTGEVLLIADEPEAGLNHCGSPTWSHDGRRILYDATPGTAWNLTHLESIELEGAQLITKDLGKGNCPNFSPDDKRIAFLSNADGVERGIWMMNADGSGREVLGDYGRPRWSPYGRQFLIAGFGNPCPVTLMDANPERSGSVVIPDSQIYSVPSWAGASTVLAVIGSQAPDQIALLDISKPDETKIKKVVWKRSPKFDVQPYYPVYSIATKHYVFVGGDDKGMALYSIAEGDTNPPKRLEPEGRDVLIVSLSLSPDGRYLLFNSNRSERHHRPAADHGSSSKAK